MADEKTITEKTTDKERWIKIITDKREIVVSSKFKEDSLKQIKDIAKELYVFAKEEKDEKNSIR